MTVIFLPLIIQRIWNIFIITIMALLLEGRKIESIFVSTMGCFNKKQRTSGPVNTHLTHGPNVIKLFFMLNSAEHEIYPAHKC